MLLDGLSLEEILLENPDFIFISTMGDEAAAKAYMDGVLREDAWQHLDAVRDGRYAYLPKELFQFKPNKRWGEAYRYLAGLLYPGRTENHMEKGTETKNRYFCRTKAGWLTLILLLLCVVLLSLRFGSAAMDGQAFWGGLLRQEGFETQSLILVFPAAPEIAAGNSGRRRAFRLRRPAAKRNRQRSGQSKHHRRQRRRRLCGDPAFKLFPARRCRTAAGCFSGRLPDDAADHGDRRPDGCLKGHRHSGRDRRARRF